MSSPQRWILGALFLLAASFLPRPERSGAETAGHAGRAAPLGSRLLGPLSEALARFHWVRFEHARRADRPLEALLHARRALRLSPRASSGWELTSAYLGLTLAAAEELPERQRAWLRTALDLLEEGLLRVDDPAALRFQAGLLSFVHAEQDRATDARDRAELYRRAAAAFERAAQEADPVPGAYLLAEECLTKALALESRGEPLGDD